MPDHSVIKNSVAIRPKFIARSDKGIIELGNAFDKILKTPSPPCKGYVHDQYVTLYPMPEDIHYWSPQLSIYMEEDDEQTLLHGRYGPRPAVWTMFVFFYSVIGVAVVIVAVIGFANMSINASGAILWLLPILSLIFLSLYLVAFFGQKKGYDQMVDLQHIVEDVLR